MKNKWPRRHYIDLFAGAGRAKVKNTGELVETSALLAASTATPFTHLHLCDADRQNCDALRKRIETKRPECGFQIICGDANEMIDKVVESVPRQDALCLTLADPFGLHLDFNTVQRLASLRSDLIVLIADNMDAIRNWAKYYYENPNSSLDRFMGEPGWRELLDSAPTSRRVESIRNRYQERLAGLGYAHFAHERLQNQQGADLYSLLFASKSPRGLDFWSKASSIDRSGQRRLF
jgi:three-Cys-motif partner protein